MAFESHHFEAKLRRLACRWLKDFIVARKAIQEVKLILAPLGSVRKAYLRLRKTAQPPSSVQHTYQETGISSLK